MLGLVIIQHRAGWHWFTVNDAGSMVLWDATPHPTAQAAEDDALDNHLRWQRDLSRQPYEGAPR